MKKKKKYLNKQLSNTDLGSHLSWKQLNNSAGSVQCLRCTTTIKIYSKWDKMSPRTVRIGLSKYYRHKWKNSHLKYPEDYKDQSNPAIYATLNSKRNLQLVKMAQDSCIIWHHHKRHMLELICGYLQKAETLHNHIWGCPFQFYHKFIILLFLFLA